MTAPHPLAAQITALRHATGRPQRGMDGFSAEYVGTLEKGPQPAIRNLDTYLRENFGHCLVVEPVKPAKPVKAMRIDMRGLLKGNHYE